jgi:hypothetical protein
MTTPGPGFCTLAATQDMHSSSDDDASTGASFVVRVHEVLVRLSLWSLADSDVTIEDLRTELPDAIDVFVGFPGLLFASWISDQATERWGSIEVWGSREASEAQLPSQARDLIGKDPELVEVFDVEATVSVAEELTRLGLAL